MSKLNLNPMADWGYVNNSRFRFISIRNQGGDSPIPPEPTTTYTVTSSCNDGGTIGPKGDKSVNEGDEYSLTIFPNADYKIDKVIDNNIDVTSLVDTNGKYKIEKVNEDHTIVVKFANTEPMTAYTVTSSCNDGGTIDPKGDKSVSVGSGYKLAIIPKNDDEGIFMIDYVKDNENDVTNKLEDIGTATSSKWQYKIDKVYENHTINVNFKPDVKYTVSVIVKKGEGTVTPKDPTELNSGKDITCTFTPGKDTVSSKQLTVKEVTDSAYLDPDGNAADVTDQVLPDTTNSKFYYDITNISKDHTLKVTFGEPGKYTITTSNDGNCTITPESADVDEWENKKFTLTPKDNYIINEVKVDDKPVEVPSDNTYTFEYVRKAHTLYVSCKEKPKGK